MAIRLIKRISSGFLPISVLLFMLLVSLYLMSEATQNSEQFGKLYFILLSINILALVMLVALIGTNLVRLVRQYRSGVTGSRLTVRLVVMFVVLAMAPVSVVYYFSLEFIQRGIDSWFNVEIEKALNDSLELSRASLDVRKIELLKLTERIAVDLSAADEIQITQVLNDFQNQSGAFEMTLLTSGGHIISSSSVNPTIIVPHLPDEGILQQLRQGISYVGLDPIRDGGLYFRIVVNIPNNDPLSESKALQTLFPVAGRMSNLADNVQTAVTRYQQLTVLRDPLKFSFILTLSLVLLLSLLTAVWGAFFSARRLLAPIRVLSIGTRAVASGDYNKQLPLHSSDELGYLVQSFNDMTRKVAEAHDDVRSSQQQAEAERAYLRAVLGRLSSGVLTLDQSYVLRTVNASARQILGSDLKGCIGKPLEQISQNYPSLSHFVEALKTHLLKNEQEWREEIEFFGASGRQMLMCGGTSLLAIGGKQTGHIIVFDDVTTMIEAQRNAAWGEVARRLAHEIKNPLTPIQLSAERLRHKYLGKMDPKDSEVLDRSTHTIVQQVQAMKEMVKAFSEYARTPQLKLRSSDLNHLINEVLDLYRDDDSQTQIDVQSDLSIPKIEIDEGRIRQLLHNLIKNSIEVTQGKANVCITIATKRVNQHGADMIEMSVEDDGPGFPENIIGDLFEPYVTSKSKGSGLGLAIVKKIVEEHGATVWAENLKHGGAAVIIRFPIAESLPLSEPQDEDDSVETQHNQHNKESIPIKRRRKA